MFYFVKYNCLNIQIIIEVIVAIGDVTTIIDARFCKVILSNDVLHSINPFQTVPFLRNFSLYIGQNLLTFLHAFSAALNAPSAGGIPAIDHILCCYF